MTTQQIVALPNNDILFVAHSESAHGRELFFSDGSAAGTRMVGEVYPGFQGGEIEDLLFSGALAFFTAVDGVHGRKLWISDGNTVSMVKDLMPGTLDGMQAGSLRAVPGSTGVVFAGTSGQSGMQLFLSDGTATGAIQLGNIGPSQGAGAASFDEFSVIGTQMWFACNEGYTGLEPWRVVISGGLDSTATYGQGCFGSNGQRPQIAAIGRPSIGSNSFAVELSQAAANATAVLNFSFQPNNINLGSCQLLLDLPAIALNNLTTDAQGRGVQVLPVPNDPNLLGLAAFGQFVVLDVGGSLFGLGSLSNGLQMVFGR